MNYLLDTVTLVRHFTSQGKIGKQAALILDAIENNKEDKLTISVVSLMEIMYLAEKKRIAIDLQKTLVLIKTWECRSGRSGVPQRGALQDEFPRRAWEL